MPVFDGELAPETEYLFWVGCAGAFDDKAQKTVRATAELLHRAGVDYVVLGPEETCTGDPARRSGNEFVFQMLAAQNVEVLNAVFEGRAPGTRKIVTTCPHCFNTLGREYPQLDGHYEVVHHTQLLNALVREGRLVPVAAPDGELADVTYHDPCYLGRHNEVYAEPRELVGASGVRLTEMPRHADRSFCCGAGGARMWMEEKIGTRVNLNRVDEALGTGAEKIATGCPFCRVMLSDGLTQRQSEEQGTEVEVLDVAQLLLAAVTRGAPSPDDAVDALGAGAPGVETTPLSGTQANGSGPASAVSRGLPRLGPAALTRTRTPCVTRPPRSGVASNTPAREPSHRRCDVPSRRGVRRRCAGSGWVCAWTPSRSGRGAQQRVIDLVSPTCRRSARSCGCPPARTGRCVTCSRTWSGWAPTSSPATSPTTTTPRGRRTRSRPAATATSPRWSPSGSRWPSRFGSGCGRTRSARSTTSSSTSRTCAGRSEYPAARTPRGGA